MTLSIPTLTLMRNTLNQTTLNVGAPDFRESALVVLTAIDEIDKAIDEATWPLDVPIEYTPDDEKVSNDG